IFAAFEATPFDAVKVVVLGQDPYHGRGQAHGLCFSVAPGVPVPPSLQNLYKELQRDLGIAPPDHGRRMPCGRQGGLRANAVLSVADGRAGAHQGKGWEGVTDPGVAVLNRGREGLVFMLGGSYAQKKGAIVDTRRHCVLRTTHPSPLSAPRGFLGCGPFSKPNRYRASRGLAAIDWSLPRRAELDASDAQAGRGWPRSSTGPAVG